LSRKKEETEASSLSNCVRSAGSSVSVLEYCVEQEGAQKDDTDHEEYPEHPLCKDGETYLYEIFNIESHLTYTSRNKIEQYACCDDGSDLSGNVDAYRLHEQEVLGILFQAHLVNYAR